MKATATFLLVFMLFSTSGFSQYRYKQNHPTNEIQEVKEDKKQENLNEGGFKWNKLYGGGGLSLGAGSNNFAIGVNPEIGYSFNKWIDVGIQFNVNYYTYAQDDNSVPASPRQRSFNYGNGLYVRGYPVEDFFIQIQPEYNWITTKYNLNSDALNGYQSYSGKINRDAASLLAGIGYGHRIVGKANFYTLLMIDLGTEKKSPYRDAYGAIIPVFRSGFVFYFGANKQ